MDNSWLFLLTFVPFVLYVIVDAYKGLKSGVIAAVIMGLVASGIFFFVLETFDLPTIFLVVLMVGMSFISVKKDNPLFFKLQPLITGLVLALVFAYFQFFDTPLGVKYLPKMKKLVDPEMASMLDDPKFLLIMSNMSFYIIFWIVAHAVLMGYAAVRWNNRWWLFWKAIGIPFISLGTFLTYMVFR